MNRSALAQHPWQPRSLRSRKSSRPAVSSIPCTQPVPQSVRSLLLLSNPQNTQLTIDQEGAWDEVMAVIGKAHAVVHQTGASRVQTSMRVGTRTDKKQTAEEKVKRVQDLLKE